MAMAGNRIAYLIVLFLSLAPMTSLYFLLLWVPSIQNAARSRNPIDASLSYDYDSSEDMVENPQVTVEKLWAELAALGIATINNPGMGNAHFSSMPSSTYRKKAISFFVLCVLFLVIPCTLFLCSWAKQVFWLSPKQKRRRQLQRHLRLRSKTLQEDDRIHSDDCIFKYNNNNNNPESRISTWRIPVAGTMLRQKEPTQMREASGECAICLGTFACQDCVAWSSNPSCSHCFHYKCILSWLSRKSATRSPSKMKMCPCCRTPFVVPFT
jgi:hypothetical protein